MLEDKDIMIRFHARVRELDRQYEKFNNQDFDNGVYHKYAYNQPKTGKDGTTNIDSEPKKDFKYFMRQKSKAIESDIELQNYYVKISKTQP